VPFIWSSLHIAPWLFCVDAKGLSFSI
jgi:hypothetical protein